MLPTIRKNTPEIWVGDSETWRHASNPAFWIFKTLDGKKKEIFYEKQAVRNWVNNGLKIIYFHNLEFDLATFLSAKEVALASKLLAGSRIIRLNYGKTEFRDSLGILTSSAGKLGDDFGMPKGKTPQKFIDGDSEKGINDDDLIYCERDIDIIIVALISLKEFYWECCNIGVKNTPIPDGLSLPLTAASFAYKVYSQSFWPFDFNTIYIDKEIFESTLKCYYGGRVQVFAEAGKIYENAFVYDINSLYPSEMIHNKFPHPKYSYREDPTMFNLHFKMSQDRVIWGKFVLKGNKNCLPFLPAVDENKRRCYTNKIFKGWLCEPELKYALSNGWEVKKIKKLYSAKTLEPFNEYVKYFYDLRLQYQNSGDSRAYFCKLLLNSLYGKFGQKDRGRRIENPMKIEEIMREKDWIQNYDVKYYNEKMWYLEEKKSSIISKNTWAGFAAFTTSYARTKLANSIRDNPTLYCDTDSIHTQISPEDIEIPLSDKLGEWKLEYQAKNVQYWEAKVYRFMNENMENIVVKHKGANRSTGDLTQTQVAVMFTKYRTSLRRNLTYGEFREVEKKSKRFHGKKM